MQQVGPYVAAWVPELASAPWDEAEELAHRWLADQKAEHGRQLLVVSETKMVIESARRGPLAKMIQTADQVTRRSRNLSRLTAGGTATVLAFYAGPHLMEIAISAASRGGSMCVVRGTYDELGGWAQDTSALDLRQSRATPDRRSVQMKEDLEQLAFAGNNGWADSYGKRDAIRILGDINGRGELDPGVILGTMLARGAHGDAAERLASLIDKQI